MPITTNQDRFYILDVNERKYLSFIDDKETLTEDINKAIAFPTRRDAEDRDWETCLD